MTFVEVAADGGSEFVNPYQVARVQRDAVENKTLIELASGHVIRTTTAQATVESDLEGGL
jgi:hypothetical protein